MNSARKSGSSGARIREWSKNLLTRDAVYLLADCAFVDRALGR